MNKEPNEGKLKTYASYGLLTLIFFLDCFLSLGYFGGIPYVIGLVLVMWILPPREMMRFGFVCGVVALLGFFSPPTEIEDNMGGLMTRFMAIFTVTAIAILTRREADVAEKQEEEKKVLNSVIEKRTSGLKQVVDQFDEVKIRLSEAEQLGHFGFWEFYPSTQQMIWSNGMFSVHGYPVSPQAPSFQEFLNLTHVDDLRILQESIEMTLAEKKPSAAEYRIIMPDGSFKWLYYKGRPVINNENQIENIVGTIQDITTLKQSAHQTDVNTAKYTTLFRSASIPKALFIPDKRIIEVNSAFCKWVGYHEKELLKIPIEKLMHKDDRSMEDAYAKDIIRGELEVFRKEKRFVRKNGQIVWGMFNVAAVLDANNRVLYFSAEIVDRTRLKAAETARKKAEAAWHEAEETLTELEAEKRIAAQEGSSPSGAAVMPADMEEELEKAYGMAEEVIDHLFEVSHDMLAIIGADGFYKRVSPAMCTLLGYQVDQLEDQSVADLLHSEEQHNFEDFLNSLFSGHPSSAVTIRHEKADGSYAWVSLEATFNQDHEVAYVHFKESDAAAASQNRSRPEKAPEPVLTQEAPPAEEPQKEEPQQEEPSSYTPPVFIEADDASPLIEEEPQEHNDYREPEDAYPSIEDHLAQLYGEVDPSKVFFDDEPPKQERKAQELPRVEEPAIEPELPSEQDVVHEQPSQELAYEEDHDDVLGAENNLFDSEPAPEFLHRENPVSGSAEEYNAEPTYQEQELYDEAPIEADDTANFEAPLSIGGLSEPLDHLYYEDDEEEEIVEPPPPPPQAPPQREFADIHWKQLTDKMPFVVWMLDDQRNCKYVNKKLRSFTGLPFEQLEGTGWSKTIHPEDYRKYVKYANEIVKDHKPVGFAYRVRRADGLYRWMQETSIPLYDKSNRFEGYLATSLDISKLKRVGAHFAKALEGAINLEDLHSSLVPCLNEESSLAVADSIKVADALINNSQEMPQRELSTLMSLAGQRMLSLVNGMLAFSSIRPKKTDLILREIDIRSVISNTVDMITPLRRTEGPRFQIDTKSDTLHVLADKVLLHRSIENLIKGLQEAAESRVITVDFAKKNDRGIISIAHIGPVLTDSFLNDLSNLYRDNKNLSLYQRKFGLHLSLIKKVCELMGGSMRVREQEDIGPVITLELKLAGEEESTNASAQQPVAASREPSRVEHVNGEHASTRPQRPAVSRRSHQEKSPRVHQPANNHHQMAEVAQAISTLSPNDTPAAQESIKANGNGKDNSEHESRQRILIGEHNRDTQRLIRSLLQPYYDLSIVPDIKAFLKQANESSYDLFLLDIHMRSDDGHHGVDILREIRKMPQYKRTPVIAVASGNSGADKNELIERAGFNDFLRKPYSIVELLDTVEKVIES